MKTHYYNAFYNENNFFIESEGLTRKEAVQDIADTNQAYAYTLKIDSKGAKRIDLESEALDAKYDDKAEYETLVKQGLAN